VFQSIRFLAWRLSRRSADAIVTSPLIRWTWRGDSDNAYIAAISEYRPTDHETVSEMMSGRYLLAARLVDTSGVSPFSVETMDRPWFFELHSFSWLRHFADARDDTERRFARTLVLDWIGRNAAGFDRDIWGQGLTAQRVLNWLRHYNTLIEGATPEQIGTITTSLGTQIQSLRLRGDFSIDPVDRLLARIALTGVALCEDRRASGLTPQLTALLRLLKSHVCEEGLFRTRNAADQLTILTELASVRTALGQRGHDLAPDIAHTADAMHRALGRLTLGTGQPGYFNGCGQLPVDLVIAVQSQTTVRDIGGGEVGGYGVLCEGRGRLVADSGRVPAPAFARHAHASVFAFEFSHANEIVVGNCGPAPASINDTQHAFRQPAAHSSFVIGDRVSAHMGRWPAFSGYLRPEGPQPDLFETGEAETGLTIRGRHFASRFGLEAERHLALLANGDTLVGQDRLEPAGRGREQASYIARFHLGAGAQAWHGGQGDVINIRLQSGMMWSFLWEGAAARIDQSVRQSAFFGFHRTQQIVLTAEAEPGREIAWIFTRQTS
jgi:uncharacterized heparinase superfamily protein